MIKKLLSMIASVMPNFIKINLYKLIGYKIGKNVKIGFMTLILANEVNIGHNVRIGALNLFRLNRLIIGRDSIIRSLNMMLGPKNLKLGKRIQIVGPFTFMNLAEDIELDDRCGIGSHSIFYTHGVYLPYTEGHPRKFGKIYLGKSVWSPCHVIFLPGVSIGDDSIITTGSVVNGSFPRDSLISGNPAKIISKASNLKTVMTKEKLHGRMKEILFNFTKDNFLENAQINVGVNELKIRKNKNKYLIKLQNGKKIENIQDYKEIIILGDNLTKVDNKKISLFDFKERKMILRGELSKIFLDYLGTYGEYFS